MEIYRLGTRMMMVMETDDAVFDAAAMAAATDTDPGCAPGKN
jgi:L-rhamnose mutarotase